MTDAAATAAVAALLSSETTEIVSEKQNQARVVFEN